MTYRSSSSKRLPEKYYVRRRVAAAVVVLVVVALLIWALVAWGGSRNDEAPEENGADAQAAGETTTALSAPAPSPEEAPESGTAESAAPEEETPASPYPGNETQGGEPADPEATTCELQDLQVTATSDQATYAPEALPTFYMTVANPTATDCVIDLDEATLRFEVYDLATNQRIWSDTDCFEPIETGEQTFEANSDRHFEAVWSRAVSAPGQCADRPAAPSGGYFLHAVVGSNPSPPHTFNLG